MVSALAICLAVLQTADTGMPAAVAGRAASPTFIDQIGPLLARRCTRCHGQAENFQAGLDLRTYADALRGGQSGPAVVPGRSGESLLYQLVRDGEMPPSKGKLTPDELEQLRRWIDAGAPAGEALGPRQPGCGRAPMAAPRCMSAGHSRPGSHIRSRGRFALGRLIRLGIVRPGGNPRAAR